jgi:hypothetical protein
MDSSLSLLKHNIATLLSKKNILLIYVQYHSKIFKIKKPESAVRIWLPKEELI